MVFVFDFPSVVNHVHQLLVLKVDLRSLPRIGWHHSCVRTAWAGPFAPWQSAVGWTGVSTIPSQLQPFLGKKSLRPFVYLCICLDCFGCDHGTLENLLLCFGKRSSNHGPSTLRLGDGCLACSKTEIPRSSEATFVRTPDAWFAFCHLFLEHN